ncbi:MAG: arsenate reductase ArsC [Ilumatobacter sp.]|nr:arsenate reductase ArsC [Ilumatobacter sp.]
MTKSTDDAAGHEQPVASAPSVLFLCTHNAGRSQMAAGWLRHLSKGTVEIHSGGSAPADELNPRAVRAMAEVGIDISDARPTRWTEEVSGSVDVVVSMGCGDTCPIVDGQRREDWELDDPAGLDSDGVRRVRDEIRSHVTTLLGELDSTSS